MINGLENIFLKCDRNTDVYIVILEKIHRHIYLGKKRWYTGLKTSLLEMRRIYRYFKLGYLTSWNVVIYWNANTAILAYLYQCI